MPLTETEKNEILRKLLGKETHAKLTILANATNETYDEVILRLIDFYIEEHIRMRKEGKSR